MQTNPPSGTPPEKPAGDAPDGQGGSGNISYNAATTISEDATEDFSGTSAVAYGSLEGGQNALLVTAGDVSLKFARITKAGDESSENSDFYGTNAAVLVTGGTLTFEGGAINTNGAHANALFAYGDGQIVAKNVSISTSSNNSGGIMVTGGGTLDAENLTVITSGNSSAPIRSDRGGGTMTIKDGSYTSMGIGSPAVYSTAEISISGATLTSNSSEGIVIEGSNSVSLENVALTDTNNSLNGNSETYKNIFIYQSMSGDAEEGTGAFASSNSTITTNQGDTFFVTNTTAKISLNGNQITNNDATSAFLRAQAGKWGTAGNNGGHVELALTNQVAEGDIVLDNLSTLSFSLSSSSFYMGVINGADTAKNISVTLDATSQLVLAGDSYINELANADPTNQNIYSNGYKLYVAGSEVEINGSEVPETPKVITEFTQTETTGTITTDCIGGSNGTDCAGATSTPDLTPFIVGGIALLVIIGAVIAIFLHNKKKNKPTGTVMGAPDPTNTPTPPEGGRPDFSAFDDSQNNQPQPPQSPTVGQM